MATTIMDRATDGSGDEVDLAVEAWTGGAINRELIPFNIQVSGVFDSATVTIEASLDGTNWGTTGISFTAAAVKVLAIVPNCKIRATLSSAGASTDLVVVLA